MLEVELPTPVNSFRARGLNLVKPGAIRDTRKTIGFVSTSFARLLSTRRVWKSESSPFLRRKPGRALKTGCNACTFEALNRLAKLSDLRLIAESQLPPLIIDANGG